MDGFAVEDFFIERRDPAGKLFLERTLKFPAAPPAGLHFRVAVEKVIEPRGANEFAVGKNLLVRLPAAPLLRDADGAKELLLPVRAGLEARISPHREAMSHVRASLTKNANGVPSSSPGLSASPGYPGCVAPNANNPEWVASPLSLANWLQPFQGCGGFLPLTQGRRFAPTLGWKMERRWRSGASVEPLWLLLSLVFASSRTPL